MFAVPDMIEDDIPPPPEEMVWDDDFGLKLGMFSSSDGADGQTILFHPLDLFDDSTSTPHDSLRSICPSRRAYATASCITDMHFPTCSSYIVNTC